MAEITASLVKELREKTGVGMMDAKKALVETNGSMDEALGLLRRKGLAKAAGKSSRTAAEGLVAIAIDGTKGAVVEVNAETDFVARNEEFQAFVRKISGIALNNANDIETLSSAEFEGGKTVQESLTDKIVTIGENMALRRMSKMEVDTGVVAGYVHNAIMPDMGKIGVLVALESEGDQGKLEMLGKQIAMHIAAAFPRYLNKESVDPAVREREKEVLRDQARESGKPDDIIEKMIDGRMRKYYAEICLLEQVFVVDGETKIGDLLENAAGDIGSPVKLTGFIRFQLGEGIEKEKVDFVAEVAAAANG